MPSNTVDLSAFQGFLARAAVDERFSADRFLAEIDARASSSTSSTAWRCKFVGIGMVRERLLAIVDRFDDFVHHEPTFGPGRFDTFNPAKALLNWNFDQIPERERIGVVDFPSVFLQGPKTGMQLHWDGNNTKVSERNRSAAFGTGATPADPRPRLARSAWRTGSPPPSRRRFADVFPGQFDAALAARGRRRSTPATAPPATAPRGATSPARTSARSRRSPRSAPTAAGSTTTPTTSRSTRTLLYADFGAERFQTFRKTDGYANAPLDGLWLRAPYLHNGSVPTLAALLSPPAERPRAFLRGYDVYDPQRDGLRQRPRPHRPGRLAAALLLRHHRRRRRRTARPARRR